MISQQLLEKPNLELTIENSLAMASESLEDLTSYHDCLVSNYRSSRNIISHTSFDILWLPWPSTGECLWRVSPLFWGIDPCP